MTESVSLTAYLRRHQLAYTEDPYPLARMRRKALRDLGRALRRHSDALVNALCEDYGWRSVGDSLYGDILSSLGSIQHARLYVGRWMRPERRGAWPPLQPGRCRVHHEPLGVVGIVVPWNYPVYLALSPLAGAIAAGNHVMIKLPERTPHANHVLRQICQEALGDRVSLHEGGVAVAAAFSRLAFDHLLFTGSVDKGRHVYAAAAEQLVPVTLELGGKSPALLTPDSNVLHAVRAVLFGKCINAGQTCIAPDYLLCPVEQEADVVAACRNWFNRLYPDFPNNPDYTQVIDESHRSRLQALCDDACAHGANLEPLADAGSRDTGAARMPLTLVRGATQNMRVMQEEIFGPVLPIVTYDRMEDAFALIRDLPSPLALYAFTHDRRLQQRILAGTRSGGVAFNEVATQVLQEGLPFGGVGSSGMGRYHGVDGFRTFSNPRAVFDRGRLSPIRMAMPPYGRLWHRLLFRMFTRKGS